MIKTKELIFDVKFLRKFFLLNAKSAIPQTVISTGLNAFEDVSSLSFIFPLVTHTLADCASMYVRMYVVVKRRALGWRRSP